MAISTTLKWALILPVMILLLPIGAMLFTHEVNWGPADFLVAAILLYGASLSIYAVKTKIQSPGIRTGMMVLILLAVLLLWLELAVGLFGSPLAGS